MKHRRRLAFGATAAAVAFCASLLPAPLASAQDEDGTTSDTAAGEEVVQSWALAPAGSDDPSEAGNRPLLSYTATPGSTIEDAVTLYNYSNVPMRFRIYATDAFNNDEGQFDILPGDQEPTGVGTWVVVPQEFIDLQPGQQATMPITITVPENATPGDHSGAIVASSPATGTGDNGERITVDRRTGPRLYLRVDGPLNPDLGIENLQLDYDHAVNPLAGSATVTFDVVNRGNVRLAGSSAVSVAGPFGLGEQRVDNGAFADLLPGERITVVTTLDDIPALGITTTKVTVTPSDEAGDLGVEAVASSSSAFTPPLTLLLGFVAFALALIALRAVRRHRQAAVGQVVTVEADGEVISGELVEVVSRGDRRPE